MWLKSWVCGKVREVEESEYQKEKYGGRREREGKRMLFKSLYK